MAARKLQRELELELPSLGIPNCSMAFLFFYLTKSEHLKKKSTTYFFSSVSMNNPFSYYPAFYDGEKKSKMF